MTTWMQCFWDEEAIWFYFEVDAGGWVTRQVELQDSELTLIAAASLDEWQRAQQAGSLAEYDTKGRSGLPLGSRSRSGRGTNPTRTAQEFEAVWDAPRRAIRAR